MTNFIGPQSGNGLNYAAALDLAQNNLATLELPFPYIPSTAPQSYSSSLFNSPMRGICSLSFLGRVWRFRTNPNQITWGYTLNTHIDQTYGGRVVQLLSTKIEDMIVKVECGNGGWAYNVGLVLFLRDLMIAQRNPTGSPAIFEYSTRGWKFNVYALTVPFQDRVTATTRELELHFKVQQDVSGVVSGALLSATLGMLQEGIGWTRNQYNSGSSYVGTEQGNTDPQSGPVGPGQITIPGDLSPTNIQSIAETINVSNPISTAINLAKSWTPSASAINAST